jgi:hypothetical protein
MALQKLFSTKYVDHLIDLVEQGKNLESYYGVGIRHDKSQILSVPQLFQPDDLIDKMNPDDNCASGIALYEAYSKITPLQAADSRLWVYLAQVDLFSYVKSKWAPQLPSIDDPERVEKMQSNIRIHWFGLQKDSMAFSPMRHSLANLWWSVYTSVDYRASSYDDKYKYTRMLFKNETFRTRTAVGFLGRNREAMYGILNFMEQCPEMFEGKTEAAFNEITKFLNCLGGTMQLSFMKRDFFLQYLLNNKAILKDKISERTAVRCEMASPKSYDNETISTDLSVKDLECVDYINVRDTISSMINNTNIQ